MELLELLKKHGAYEAFLRNYKDFGKDWFSDITVVTAFRWARTPEGWAYWNDIEYVCGNLCVPKEVLMSLINNTKKPKCYKEII